MANITLYINNTNDTTQFNGETVKDIKQVK